ncbi:MAG: phosphotransferase [Gammaproteobacteria bacterium]|nr:phosphotransferase [Gammaproteobacteria bacterium]
MNMPTPESITPDWLTEQLRRAGHTATVKSFTRTSVGTGQIGKCIRFELELIGDDAPRSLIGKFASDDAISRATGVQLRNYYREVSFYRELAPKVSISLPRCYYADILDEGPDFVLILEDLRPARQGDQLAGCSPAVARSSVLELVGLQAPTWCDQTLRRFDWLGEPPVSPTLSLMNTYAQLLPAFIDRYGHRLADDERRIITRVATSPQCPLYAPPAEIFCLEHVDYRLDNMLIDERTSPPRVSVVDWQSVKIGKPLNDVAYFLGAGLLPEVRREVEAGIVRDYHAALQAAGVSGLTWDRCWLDYRRGSFAGFGVTVIASMIVQQTPRGDDMFVTMARRHSRHALDVGAEQFLD